MVNRVQRSNPERTHRLRLEQDVRWSATVRSTTAIETCHRAVRDYIAALK